jgi:4-hydroxybenzoate polyprenyltransferase
MAAPIQVHAALAEQAEHQTPLVVRLERTLVIGDLYIEAFLAEMANGPRSALAVTGAALGNRTGLRRRLADRLAADAAELLYDRGLVERLRKERASGRKLYLASGDEALGRAVAAHLGLFDDVVLVDRKGQPDMLPAGVAPASFTFWDAGHAGAAAEATTGTDAPRGHLREVPRDGEMHGDWTAAASPTLKDWIKLCRVHQWAKNLLVFLPILTAHAFTAPAFLNATLAFFAFSFCASSVYLLNDLVDLRVDRQHPTKRNRPFASGKILPRQGMLLIPVLLAAAFALGFSASPQTALILGAYFAATTAYSFYLKRKLMADVILLSGLYTLRVIGGAVAISVMLSPWLVIFSVMIFTALALMKRYVEILKAGAETSASLAKRGYRVGDSTIVGAIAAAASMNAVTVFGLYLSSDIATRAYSHPAALWLICPLLMFWLGRALVMAHRLEMNDDPVIFALKDRVSLMTGALVVLTVISAI